MPTTRSRSQPTLQYPRRKSSRAAAAKGQPVARAEPSPSGAVLPLSPRKRLGDENGCNLPPGVLGSPPKQSRLKDPSPARGSRRLSFDENAPCRDAPSPVKPAAPSCPSEAPSSPKLGTPQRACTTPTAARSPFRCRQETPGSLPAGAQGERRPPVVRLFADENSRFQQVKQALHTSLPERLLSRDRESAVIRSFLCERVKGRRPGSLYISGAPGTGKTACLTRTLQDCREELQGAQCVFINCMTLRSSQAVFALVAERLGAAGGRSQPKDSDRRLEKLVTHPGPMVLLVLDEMDQLDSKAQDVLYTIFEWPWLAGSRLCLIGIANALDLTDRILPRLQARPHCRPLLLNFPPYSRQELTAIVQDRLAQVSGEPVLDGVAVQFCARKVSAVSGDARKALDICRRAVEMVESDVRSQKASESKGVPRASLPQVSRVLSEVYGERMAGGEAECFPLQQKLLVCALLLQSQHGKTRELPLGKLHEVYSRLCRQRQVSAVAPGECLSLCTLLESRGVFGLKKAKEARLTKVSLKMQEKDVEHALKDKALLGSILAAGLP
ncbi:CDC6 protein, partial [Atractosteus spatula]|nr:CDC6 protein [Atractosteus spatula]